MPRGKRVVESQVRKVVEDVISQAIKEDDDGERVPGKVVNGVKTPWTRKDMDRIYGICEFTPEETIPVTVHGQLYYLIAGVTMVAPKIIRDTYLDHRRRMQRVGKSLSSLGVESFGGIGALTPET